MRLWDTETGQCIQTITNRKVWQPYHLFPKELQRSDDLGFLTFSARTRRLGRVRARARVRVRTRVRRMHPLIPGPATRIFVTARCPTASSSTPPTTTSSWWACPTTASTPSTPLQVRACTKCFFTPAVPSQDVTLGRLRMGTPRLVVALVEASPSQPRRQDELTQGIHTLGRRSTPSRIPSSYPIPHHRPLQPLHRRDDAGVQPPLVVGQHHHLLRREPPLRLHLGRQEDAALGVGHPGAYAAPDCSLILRGSESGVRGERVGLGHSER